MKVTLNLKPLPEAIEHTYPALYRNLREDFIVLASSSESGTVVEIGKSPYKIGHYSRKWVEFDCKKTWTRLELGEFLTLENT